MHEKEDFNFSDRNVPLLEANVQFGVEENTSVTNCVSREQLQVYSLQVKSS